MKAIASFEVNWLKILKWQFLFPKFDIFIIIFFYYYNNSIFYFKIWVLGFITLNILNNNQLIYLKKMS